MSRPLAFYFEDSTIRISYRRIKHFNFLATEIFDSPIAAFDSVITIDDTSFVINGVLSQMGTVSSGISPDEAIYVPYSTGAKHCGHDVMRRELTCVPAAYKVTEHVQTVYSCRHCEDQSIIYLECEDHDACNAKLRATEVCKKWNIEMLPRFFANPVMPEKIFDLSQQLDGELLPD